MNIVLLGLPGAGKGTQAKAISEHFSIPHVSTGELFRKAHKDGTDLGLLARGFMERGELVPDEVTIGIALNRIGEADCNEGFLLDGFPRNVNQAQSLRDFLLHQSRKIDHVVYVKVDEGILLERLTGRRVCTSCGASFHVLFYPPATLNQCDACQGALVQRDDDREDTVKERLKVNRELTHQLVNFYEGDGIVRLIDGSGEVEQVSRDIIRVLEYSGKR